MVWTMEGTLIPITKMGTIRALIVVASIHQWHISQMDVKNIFLNGDVKEGVHMVPFPGVSHNLGEVFRLKKSLCGLKQVP